MPNQQISLTNLRIAAININSICAQSRRLELLDFSNKQNLDAIFLSETKLNAKLRLSFANYHLIRNDRPNAKCSGDTAILIRKNLKFETVTLPQISEFQIVECTILKLLTVHKKKLFLVSLYARNNNRTLFIKELNSLFTALHLEHQGSYYIIAGDFNARHKQWGDRANNQRGRLIKRWEEAHEHKFRLKIITPIAPTFKPAHTYLDICMSDARLYLTNNHSSMNKAPTLPYISDYAAISLSFELPNDTIPTANPSQPSQHLNFKATNWEAFSAKLNSNFKTSILDNRNLTIVSTISTLVYPTPLPIQSLAFQQKIPPLSSNISTKKSSSYNGRNGK